MFGFINKGKDAALSKLAHIILTQLQVNRYGTVTDLQLNSEMKEIQCLLDLKGEDKPLEVRASFEIIDQGNGQKVVILGDVSTSREWLNLLVTDYLTHEMRRIPIPSSAFALLKALRL